MFYKNDYQEETKNSSDEENPLIKSENENNTIQSETVQNPFF